MFKDSQNEFSVAQTIATAASTNNIDLGPTKGSKGRDIGVGQPLYLVLNTPTPMTGTSPTVTATLKTDTSPAFGSAKSLMSTPALTPADFANGPVVFALPGNVQKYLRVDYGTGGTVTGGTIDAFLTTDAQRWAPYARNYTA